MNITSQHKINVKVHASSAFNIKFDRDVYSFESEMDDQDWNFVDFYIHEKDKFLYMNISSINKEPIKNCQLYTYTGQDKDLPYELQENHVVLTTIKSNSWFKLELVESKKGGEEARFSLVDSLHEILELESINDTTVYL